MHSNNDGMDPNWRPSPASDFEIAVSKFYNSHRNVPLTQDAAQFGREFGHREMSEELRDLKARAEKAEAEIATVWKPRVLERADEILSFLRDKLQRTEAELALCTERLGPAGVEMLRDLKSRAEKAEAERDRFRKVLVHIVSQNLWIGDIKDTAREALAGWGDNESHRD